MLGDYVYTSMLGVDWSDLSLAVVGRKVTTPENFYSYDGKVANGCKNRPHDAYLVRCRIPGYYEQCSERVRVCQFKKRRQSKSCPPVSFGSVAGEQETTERFQGFSTESQGQSLSLKPKAKARIWP